MSRARRWRAIGNKMEVEDVLSVGKSLRYYCTAISIEADE